MKNTMVALLLLNLACAQFAYAAESGAEKVAANATEKSAKKSSEKSGKNSGPNADMMALCKPREGHKALNDLVGDWTYVTKFWESPNGKPNESTGTSKSVWALDGRFLQQNAKGIVMDQPFEGTGMTGYDNLRKEYQSTWADNMSTHLMYLRGTMDASKKVLTSTGTGSDFMTGNKNAQIKTVITIVDKDHHNFEYYTRDAHGRMFKSMEINYTREKHSAEK